MDAVNRYASLDYPVAPTLFFEFHGDTDRAVVDQAEGVQALAAEHGGRGFRFATRPEERARLWKARHDAYYADLALRPGAKAWTTDVCVPISRSRRASSRRAPTSTRRRSWRRSSGTRATATFISSIW